MDTPPPDLSTCQRCGRGVPPATNPQFAEWEVTKNDQGKVAGMLCPECQTALAAEQATGT